LVTIKKHLGLAALTETICARRLEIEDCRQQGKFDGLIIFGAQCFVMVLKISDSLNDKAA
jgi:hypothetical protein